MLSLHAIELEAIEYPLRAPLTRAGEPIRARAGLRIVLHDSSGAQGIGEALPMRELGCETLEEMWSAARGMVQRLEQTSLDSEELLAELALQLRLAPATRCAFDLAAYDLASRLSRTSVSALLAPAPRSNVRVNALLGGDDVATTLAAARRARARGFDTLKVKVGVATPRLDVERLAALRAECGAHVRIRIDANGAWTVPMALDVLDRLAPLDIELAEQPVATADLDGLAHVSAKSPIRIAADESLSLEEGRERFARGELSRIAVLKPTALGGFAPALSLARAAESFGASVLVTTSLDGPLGTEAALHLAAACGSAELAHGLDACSSIDVPFPDFLIPARGELRVPRGAGLGDWLHGEPA